jgi:hypothetical protein
MDSSRSPESLSEALSELADLAAGLGILLLPLFPLAIPVMALVLGPLILLGLVAALLAIPLLPPYLLARALLRRRAAPRFGGPRSQRSATRRVYAQQSLSRPPQPRRN